MTKEVYELAKVFIEHSGVQLRPVVLRRFNFDLINKNREDANKVKYELRSSDAFIVEFLSTLLNKSIEDYEYRGSIVVEINQTRLSEALRSSRSQVWKALNDCLFMGLISKIDHDTSLNLYSLDFALWSKDKIDSVLIDRNSKSRRK